VDVHPDSYREGSLGARAVAKWLVLQERDYFLLGKQKKVSVVYSRPLVIVGRLTKQSYKIFIAVHSLLSSIRCIIYLSSNSRCQIASLTALQVDFVLFVLDTKRTKKVKAKGCFHTPAIAPPPFCRANALEVPNMILSRLYFSY
jgi:hypothetical protein